MRQTAVALAVVCLGLTALSCESANLEGVASALGVLSGDEELTAQTVADGLREALSVATDRAVESASAEGGYLDEPRIRIKLPEELQRVANALRRIGLGEEADRLEAKMNAAAEEAAAQAAPVFLQAVRGITFADAKQILRGGESAATDYLRSASEESLRTQYQPIVERHLEQLGVVRTYREVLAEYNKLPLAPHIEFSLEDSTTQKALDGLFTLLAEEERRIRENPAARTTELLRKVFGGA